MATLNYGIKYHDGNKLDVVTDHESTDEAKKAYEKHKKFDDLVGNKIRYAVIEDGDNLIELEK